MLRRDRLVPIISILKQWASKNALGSDLSEILSILKICLQKFNQTDIFIMNYHVTYIDTKPAGTSSRSL